MYSSLTVPRIRNPLVGVPRDTLMRSAEKFAADNDLNDILPLLKKGALAAQNPAQVASMDDFTDEEKEIFQEEITHKWRQPKILYVTIILNSVAGMCTSPPTIDRSLTLR